MKIKIKIPFKTPSVNHMYGRNRYGATFLKKEGKILREQIKEILDPMWLDAQSLQNKKLKLKTVIYENWYTKDGRIKRKDISNREKFLTDSVFEALNLEDKQVFNNQLIKADSEDDEFAVIEINEIEDKIKK